MKFQTLNLLKMQKGGKKVMNNTELNKQAEVNMACLDLTEIINRLNSLKNKSNNRVMVKFPCDTEIDGYDLCEIDNIVCDKYGDIIISVGGVDSGIPEDEALFKVGDLVEIKEPYSVYSEETKICSVTKTKEGYFYGIQISGASPEFFEKWGSYYHFFPMVEERKLKNVGDI